MCRSGFLGGATFTTIFHCLTRKMSHAGNNMSTTKKAASRVGSGRLVSLSFYVYQIHEKLDGTTRYFDTDLRSYTTGQFVTVRGKPWRIGQKVDFMELANTKVSHEAGK